MPLREVDVIRQVIGPRVSFGFGGLARVDHVTLRDFTILVTVSPIFRFGGTVRRYEVQPFVGCLYGKRS